MAPAAQDRTNENLTVFRMLAIDPMMETIISVVGLGFILLLSLIV
jgi:hypothetical protein